MLKLLLQLLLSILLSSTLFAETTKIGVLLPLSGNYSTLGEDCRLGIEIGKILHPSEKITLIYADSQAEPKIAVTEFNKLVDSDKVSAVILSRSPVGLAVNPASLKREIPILGMVGHEEFIKQNKFAFQFWPTPTEEGKTLAKASLKLGKKRAAVITSDDDWLLTLQAAFKSEFITNGGEIIQEELIPGSETDLSTVLIRGLSKKPDLIYLNISIGTIAPGLRRLRERSPDIKVISNFWMGRPEVMQAAGIQNSNGVGFPEISLEKEKFRAAYNKLNSKRTLGGMVYNCYSSYAVLAQVVGNITGAINSKEIYQELLKITKLKLVDEELEVRDRIVSYDLAYKEIREGEVIEVRE